MRISLKQLRKAAAAHNYFTGFSPEEGRRLQDLRKELSRVMRQNKSSVKELRWVLSTYEFLEE